MKNKLLICSTALLMSTGLLTVQSCKKTEETPKTETQTGNSLLSGSVKGKAFSTGMINDFTLASEGNAVVLLAANNNTGMVYAIDLEDADASKASENEITGNVSDFGTRLAAALGTQPNQLGIVNMEVNPISGSIYIMVYNNSSQSSSLVKVTKAGTDIKVLNFDNVTYSAIQFSAIGERINDMSYGNKTLYLSFSHSTTLAGKVGSVQAPFTHNGKVSDRATTVFKTNWGNSYYTDAPLESMCYGKIGSENRLMGVTVCAPGFSFKTEDINSGTGLLEVREYFNLNTGSASKVFTSSFNNNTYLIEQHDNGRITRIGKKYLDGSQTSFNNNAKYILASGGTTVAAGLTDEDVKIVHAGNLYIMSAPYNGRKILTFNNSGALGLLDL